MIMFLKINTGDNNDGKKKKKIRRTSIRIWND